MNDYSSLDALALAELVRTKQVSPRELVTQAIERIERLNPRLNAVVHRMYDHALQVADGDIPDGAFRGVPFLMKDLLAWYAGAPTTSGSRLYKGWMPPHDTELVSRYKKAGVIVLGKTNTPEFGLTPYTEPELFGPACNPWDTRRTTGGSSGGSAAAVASGMVPMASGGDGGGSIRIPSSCCGVFGLKPTRGRNPAGPVHGEIWQGAVSEHVITRSVRDSAVMLDAISGPDAGAPYWAERPSRPFALEVGAPPGKLRCAFTHTPFLGHEVHEDCRAALADAVQLLESLGHEVVEGTPPVERERFNRAFLTLVCGEMAADLRDAVQWVKRKATPADVEVTTWALAMLGEQLSAADFAEAERYLRHTARGVGAFFERIDVLVTPTVSTPPFSIGALQPPGHEKVLLRVLGTLRAGRLLKAIGALEKTADRIFDWMPYTPLFNVTGQPGMSVPLHWNAQGLPIGTHVVGRYGDEATLLRLASQLEAARPWVGRTPPVHA